MGPQIAALPFAAGCLGVVLVVGTAVGQAGHSDASVDFDPMGGMDMSGMNMGAPATDMPAMNMDDPDMAAAMPGGFHATCGSEKCTVVFAATSSGTARILGTTVELGRVTGDAVTLLVGHRAIELRKRHPVTAGAVRARLVKADDHEVTVEFTRPSPGTPAR